MKRTKWIRLKEGNDWGHVYYCEEPLGGPVQTADYARGYRFVSGETLRVRVGDKRKRCFDGRVWLDQRTVRISDMGRDYDTRVNFPRIYVRKKFYRPDQVDIDAASLEGRSHNDDLEETLASDPIDAIRTAVRGQPSLADQGLDWLLNFGSARVPP